MARVKRSQQAGIPGFIKKNLKRISEKANESGFKAVWQREGDKIFRSIEEEVVDVAKELQGGLKKGQTTEGSYYPNVTVLGDRKVSELKMKALPKNYVKTDLVEGFWTLPLEILWILEARPIARGFASSEPGFSDIYEFFVGALNQEALSDEETKVNDIPPHRWFEAFTTLQENNLIELSSEKKFQPQKV